MSSTIGLIGTKLGMTHVFDETGNSVPVTVIQAGPCSIVQIKKPDTDGYSALQVGFSPVPKHRVNKPLQGHFKKAGVHTTRRLVEFRTQSIDGFEVGAELTVSQFTPGQSVDVQGKPIGKGFMGATKRHHFGRGPMSHGSKSHRIPGSIGAGTTPGRVYKGVKMSGRKPNKVVTVKQIQVVQIDTERNLLLVRGSIPGSTGAQVKIVPARIVGGQA
jgi:large subunit ribosomal protein L3